MIVSMQGNWTVSVKSKSAAFPQRFVISGAATGNGPHPGIPGTSVFVTGNQWTIAIQNDPGTGFQLSDTLLKFPRKVGTRYEFDIQSNDLGADNDFNDLILTCSTPATINDFVVYGNVSLYSGRCIFNPCRRRGPFVIDTIEGLDAALRNPKIAGLIETLYPERVPVIRIPNPPDPPPDFKPIVLDLFGEAKQSKTALVYKRLETPAVRPVEVKGKTGEAELPDTAISNFQLLRTVKTDVASAISSASALEVVGVIDKLRPVCHVEPASNITLTFEEYDRTAAEKAGGPYTGTGSRQLLGDTITDSHGNYIFRFRFDMTWPGLEDAGDLAPGEDVNVVLLPDVIVKVTGYGPNNVLYESAPYYNIPNLKRIDLCLPKSRIRVPSACFNGNVIGSLGNVFLGGNQNTSASTSPAALQRYGNNNFLEANGKISVGSSLALFNIECAAWTGTIDMRGCLYDAARSAADNTIRWYTIRVRRAGSSPWQFVSQNYKHPKYSHRNLPNYTGDDVGPFSVNLHVDGAVVATPTPAYINIQREIFAEGVDWEFSNLDRYMQLDTTLYDLVAGVRTPGTLHVRVDGYDAAGNPVPNATDMIALYVHNVGLDFGFSGPSFADSSILNVGCGLYRLRPDQRNAPMQIGFKASDPYGFVDSYQLTTHRCPGPTLAVHLNPPSSDILAGETTLLARSKPTNVHSACPGYSGTLEDFTPGMVTMQIQPSLSEGGWLRSGEAFVVMSFTFTARMRVTNGYNTGLSGEYRADGSIYLEPLP